MRYGRRSGIDHGFDKQSDFNTLAYASSLVVSASPAEAMLRHACALGLEGIVSKRVTSRYKSGSCLAWVKVKNPRPMSGGRVTPGGSKHQEARRSAESSAHPAHARRSGT